MNLTNIILDKWRHLYLYLEASSSLNISRYFFFYENEYPDPCKPTFRHKIRHIISISIKIRILILTSGSFFSSLQVVRYCFWRENWNPDPNKPIFIYIKAYWSVTSSSLPDWPLESPSSALQEVRYNFCCENWNPDHRKLTFRHTWRYSGVWLIYLYLVSLQNQPPAASKWPNILFNDS